MARGRAEFSATADFMLGPRTWNQPVNQDPAGSGAAPKPVGTDDSRQHYLIPVYQRAIQSLHESNDSLDKASQGGGISGIDDRSEHLQAD